MAEQMNREDRDRLIRMEERIETILRDVTGILKFQNEQLRMNTDVAVLQNKVKELEETIKLYVTKEEFSPIKNMFWATATTLVTVIVAGLLGLILL